MSRVRVAAAALNQTPLAWEDNCQNIRAAIRAARASDAQVLCLPELCVTGYGCEDAFYSEEVAHEALSLVLQLASETKGLLTHFGLPLLVQGVLYNAVAVAADGKLRGFVAKQNLAGDGLHYEPRWFKPWPSGVATTIAVGNDEFPVGDIFFKIGEIRVGFEICEDAWVANRPGFALAQHGVDIILNPSASHFAFGKHEIRKRLILEGARACGAAYLYANLLGNEAGRVIYDGDTFVASHGEIVAQGGRFSFEEIQVTVSTVDIARSRLQRRQRVGFSPRYDGQERQVAIGGFRFRSASDVEPQPLPCWESTESHKHEEFSRAVALGLFDYLRKSRSHGFVVSLSGGVDSSAVSCFVAIMVQMAVQELGIAGVKKRLGYIPWMKSIRSERELVREILTCAYQATKNSSTTTHEAAMTLAQEIGATFYDLSIDSIVDEYQTLIEKAVGTRLSWSTDDVALQNIQARVRAPSIWLIANLRRALLLTTSNRSEASVGYTTMDGDSSGGLAPLGGIDKAYLRAWLQWLEQCGPQGIGCFSSLSLVNQQQPTAELRPLKAKQTDENDLMPYVVLDSIERRAVRDKLMPLKVWEYVSEEYRGTYSKDQLGSWVVRFFSLWSSNQWKRERYAPSFHVDDESVDPKTWCRFPILSGGFRKELEDLKKKMTVSAKSRKS